MTRRNDVDKNPMVVEIKKAKKGTWYSDKVGKTFSVHDTMFDHMYTLDSDVGKMIEKKDAIVLHTGDQLMFDFKENLS